MNQMTEAFLTAVARKFFAYDTAGVVSADESSIKLSSNDSNNHSMTLTKKQVPGKVIQAMAITGKVKRG